MVQTYPYGELVWLKTQQRATHLLSPLIFCYLSGGAASFTLAITTNVAISTTISQSFPSSIAMFHLRPPMAFLSHSSCDVPGLDYLMNVSFSERRDFHLSFSGRMCKETFETVAYEVIRSIWGSYKTLWSPPSPKCYTIATFWSMTICSDTLHWFDITLTCDLVTELDLTALLMNVSF